jgi:hypothetical protein
MTLTKKAIMQACTALAIRECVVQFCRDKSFNPKIGDAYNGGIRIKLDEFMKKACNDKFSNPDIIDIFPFVAARGEYDQESPKIFLRDNTEKNLYKNLQIKNIADLTSIFTEEIFTKSVDTTLIERTRQETLDMKAKESATQNEYETRRDRLLDDLCNKVSTALSECLDTDPSQRRWFETNGKKQTFILDTERRVNNTITSHLRRWTDSTLKTEMQLFEKRLDYALHIVENKKF